MLLKFDSYSEIDARKLMDLYIEGNVENVDWFYPDMTDKSEALTLVESRFLDYLKNDFFKTLGSSCYVLEDSGVWVSALRLSLVNESVDGNFFYMEALETRPDYRRCGFATKLIADTVSDLKRKGCFSIFDSVSKRNEASIKTHMKAGFRIVSDEGYDYLRNESCDGCYGMELKVSSTS